MIYKIINVTNTYPRNDKRFNKNISFKVKDKQFTNVINLNTGSVYYLETYDNLDINLIKLEKSGLVTIEKVNKIPNVNNGVKRKLVSKDKKELRKKNREKLINKRKERKNKAKQTPKKVENKVIEPKKTTKKRTTRSKKIEDTDKNIDE